MAFKLTKDEEAKLEELKSDLNLAYIQLEGTVSTYNEAEKALRDPVQGALNFYNERLSNLLTFVENVAEEKRAEFDDKSDSWKEGDNGSAVDEWISTWENVDLDDVSIEFPSDDLQIEFDNHADEELPTEP